MDKILKVGELAALAGVSVRTLHHYQEIGILLPLDRTGAGYRQYGREQVLRLQQITSLREIGLSLSQIKRLLDDEELSPIAAIRMHVATLEEQLARTTGLRDRLNLLLDQFESARTVALDDVLATLREINSISKHFSPEQIETLKRRAAALGPDRLEAAQEEWKELLEQFERLAKNGTAPTHPDAVAGARRARRLVTAFSGGDQAIERGVAARYRDEGATNILAKHGWRVDPAAFELLQRAMKALDESDA